MTELALPAAWTERSFERGTYGPGDRGGLAAAFVAEDDDAALEVTPVRYRRRDGHDEFSSHVDDFEHRSGTVAIRGPREVRPRTVFALRARFSPLAREREVVFVAAGDADDALAVACQLARHCPDARALRDRVDDHGGAGGGTPTLSDDEVMDATVAEAADRCVFRGVPTASHDLHVPLRYAVAAGGYPHTDAGVPRVPTLVAGFDARVSHDAWVDQGLGDLDRWPSLERRGPGRYVLPAGDALAEADAEHFSLARHWDVDGA